MEALKGRQRLASLTRLKLRGYAIPTGTFVCTYVSHNTACLPVYCCRHYHTAVFFTSALPRPSFLHPVMLFLPLLFLHLLASVCVGC
ncbi:hypothetical protein LY78DRAFT_444701 [Colletotrichum sublineola]|nr:hypothetical protein LY78DRAFT_444701 [Colletotrichum sublineola]